MSILTGTDGDYFSIMGYRRLALSMLEDAVTEIASDPGSLQALEQQRWLAGETGAAISAQLCLEAVAGPNPNGLERLRQLVCQDPVAAQHALRQAIRSFDTLMERGAQAGSESRMSQYRSMAQTH